MATSDQIIVVRRNTSELEDTDPYTDAYIAQLIDANGIPNATLIVWQQKAASHASLVDVTEAGASHKFSDMFDADTAMIKYWEGVIAESEEPITPLSVGPRVKKIVRT